MLRAAAAALHELVSMLCVVVTTRCIVVTMRPQNMICAGNRLARWMRAAGTAARICQSLRAPKSILDAVVEPKKESYNCSRKDRPSPTRPVRRPRLQRPSATTKHRKPWTWTWIPWTLHRKQPCRHRPWPHLLHHLLSRSAHSAVLQTIFLPA